jgi:hypothetical protein
LRASGAQLIGVLDVARQVRLRQAVSNSTRTLEHALTRLGAAWRVRACAQEARAHAGAMREASGSRIACAKLTRHAEQDGGLALEQVADLHLLVLLHQRRIR